MNFGKMAFAVLATVVVATCRAAPAPTSPFDAQTARHVLENGRNTIVGRALLRSGNGYVRTCRDEGVVLYAVTAYSRDIVTLASGDASGGFAREPLYSALFDDSPLPAYSRQTACDREGRFRFEGIPDGRYYLVANITWLVKTARAGGAVIKSVDAGGGSTRSFAVQWILPY